MPVAFSITISITISISISISISFPFPFPFSFSCGGIEKMRKVEFDDEVVEEGGWAAQDLQVRAPQKDVAIAQRLLLHGCCCSVARVARC
jgi:hypothetical protein